MNYASLAFLSRDELFHFLNEGFLITNPVLRFPNGFTLQRKLGKNCDDVEASQCGNDLETESFIVLHPFTVIVYSGAEKEVAPSCVSAEHRHLYLVIIAVSALQLDETIINE